MEKNALKITSSVNSNVSIEAVPGHFVTSHSHINYYIDITKIKHRHRMARDAAGLLAAPYANVTPVDTIICMDGSEILAAYLADELSKDDMMSVNRHQSINIVPPEFNSNGQMIFRDNLQHMVYQKNVLLLIASITTGKTLHRVLECVDYYGGNVVGVSSVFSAKDEVDGVEVHSIFTAEDIPNYHTSSHRDCPQCKQGVKIDALVNSYGYSEI